MVTVNNSSNRTSRSAANTIFDRLYPKCKFAKWLVTHAYAICKAKAPDQAGRHDMNRE